MANSYVEYTGNGSLAAYNIPYSYLETSHISATVNGSAASISVSGSTCTFSSAPADQSKIKISRDSSPTTRLVDYTQPSTLTEEDLDTDSIQTFYLCQEAIDKVQNDLTISAVNVTTVANESDGSAGTATGSASISNREITFNFGIPIGTKGNTGNDGETSIADTTALALALG